jgi:peroxiredoxin
MIEVGQQAPDFTLRNQEGEKVSLADYRGRKLMLVFYPADFSPVCGDQFSIYQEVKPQIDETGAELVGISVDSAWAHRAFQEKLGFEFTLLSDFEPKGEVARAYGSYIDRVGTANRTLVLIDEGGQVAWTYESPNPGEFPGANVIFDALS